MAGVVSEAEYQKFIKETWFHNNTVPVTFNGFNTPGKIFIIDIFFFTFFFFFF